MASNRWNPRNWAQQKWSKEELRSRLSHLQYKVTQEEGTEPPFQNEYWNNKRDGIYVDVVSGEPLFCSLDKYDSGTGWPSFTRPLEPENISTRIDRKLLFMTRTEVRSRSANSHLGHVFENEPTPTGLRYCMNSASLRFVPVEDLEKEGYGEYLKLFQAKEAKKHETPHQHETAILAGGCFWGIEDILRNLPGVIDTEVGYTGGKTESPTYEEVRTGRTGHAEAVRVTFDSKRLTFSALLDYFFRLHDPTTPNRQGNDVGTQYRSAIFYQNSEQKLAAEKKIIEVQKSGYWKSPIVTELVPFTQFHSAEEYHQDYLVKNPGGYTCHWLRD